MRQVFAITHRFISQKNNILGPVQVEAYWEKVGGGIDLALVGALGVIRSTIPAEKSTPTSQ